MCDDEGPCRSPRPCGRCERAAPRAAADAEHGRVASMPAQERDRPAATARALRVIDVAEPSR
jgi:hypothetical protein